jgi:hypothetical protein
MAGYATQQDAYAVWANIKGNDFLSVTAVNIGFGEGNPAEKNVCWIILPVAPIRPDILITAKNLLGHALDGGKIFPTERAREIISDIDAYITDTYG